MNLDGVRMNVSATAEIGIVGSETLLLFTQKGSRVFARYSGGAVTRGWLVGTLAGAEFTFRYVQCEASGEIHAGHSLCDVLERPEGRLRIVEHFQWHTREGRGTNVFDQVDG